MRILHFSDVHIGVENYGHTDPDTGLSTRLVDFLETLDEVVECALNENVDLALFCGDAYKSRDPSQTHQREFAKRVARLSSAGIPVFLLMGNHDMPHITSRATALEIFQTLDVPNVYTVDRFSTKVVETTDGPIQIVALPWIRRSNFLARNDTRGLTPEQINESIQRSISDGIDVQVQDLDLSIPSIFAGHVSVSEATVGSEQSMMLGTDHVLLKSNLSLPSFDYVALGHVHRHQILGHNPLIVYSGSLQRVDFGEEADSKGFCLVDIDPRLKTGERVTDFQFREVHARQFLTIKIDLHSNDEDPTSKVVQEIKKYNLKGSIVKVQIKIPVELDSYLRQEEIRQSLEEAHYVASISREMAEQPRNRLGQATSESLEPKEALRLYFESKGVSVTRSEKLIQHAEELMDGYENLKPH